MLNRKTLEALRRELIKVTINVIGMLVVEKNICAELFESTVESVVVRGKLVAPDEIRESIDKINAVESTGSHTENINN